MNIVSDVPYTRIEVEGFKDHSGLISQSDYLAYKYALEDLQQEATRTELSSLMRRNVQVINQMHAKLHACAKEQTAGEYLLAADLYNTSLKVMKVWNESKGSTIAKELLIHSPHVPESTELQAIRIAAKPITESEKALNRYLELLKQYPQVKREGPINDHKLGTYEIIYDLNEIYKVQNSTYETIYKKTNSHEIATKASMIGVVYEDPWAVIIRDAVISPHGKRHTYIRFFWKAQLNGTEAGAAIMPIMSTQEGVKVGLILTNRHATSWEFEIPRGSARPGESSADTAKRELAEEMGGKIDKPLYLGKMAPDTGILASVIPVYRGDILEMGQAKQERTEAIKGAYWFSFQEIQAALKNKDVDGNSYLEVMIEGEKKRFPLRDPFLVYALFQHQLITE